MDKNISFKSNIRLVTPEEFRQIANKIGEKNFVKYPWTVKQSVLANSAYTKDIFDCTVCGLTDGQTVLLNHICPTVMENNNFDKIAGFIKSKIDLTNSNLQGFLLGSKKNFKESPFSTQLFENFANFLQKHNIQFSQFKGSIYPSDVAYSSLKDEWVISNYNITAPLPNSETKKILNNIFDDIKISELDEIV